MKSLSKYLILLVPVIFYIIYEATGTYIWRALIIPFLLGLVFYHIIVRKMPLKDWIAVAGAFFLSVFGDLFLHLDGQKHSMLFVTGVGLYLLAHVCYIVFSLQRGKVKWWLMTLLTVVFVLYFIFWLHPSPYMQGWPLQTAVLLYILISCLSVSSAAGIRIGARGMDCTAKTLVIIGISSLLFSDFLISLHNFLHINTGYALMLPTFYLSQILVTAALIHLSRRGE
jgi:uncharacterized membrane protein YhhN